MGESIRSLVVKLGFDVDTTGAGRFRSSLKDVKKALDDFKTGKISLKEFEKAFNKEFDKTGKSMKKRVKRVMLGVAAAVSAGIAMATKAFTGFATVEQARIALGSLAGEDKLKQTLDTLKKMPAELKKVTTEADLLEAVFKGYELTGDLDFILEILPFAIEKSKILGRSLSDVMGILTGAVRGDLKSAVSLGFSSAQLEQQKQFSGVQGKDYGIPVGQQIVRGLIAGVSAKTSDDFEKYTKSSVGSIDGLKAALVNAVNVSGEKNSEWLKKVVSGLTGVVSVFGKEDIGKELRESKARVEGIKPSMVTPGGVKAKQVIVEKTENTVHNAISITGVVGSEEQKRELAKTYADVIDSSTRKTQKHSKNNSMTPRINQ